MMRLNRTKSCFKSALALLVTGTVTTVNAADKINYEEHVKPILRNACFNCHNPDDKKADLDLTTYTALMQGSGGFEVVIPGSPDESTMYLTMAHIEEPTMPPKKAKLPDATIKVIEDWIKGGLLENAGSKAIKSKKPKLDLALNSAPTGKPEGPPPMPKDVLLDPLVHTQRNPAVITMASSPWAPLIAVGGQRQVVLYNTDTLQLAGILPYPEGFPKSLHFTRNSKMLVAGGGRGADIGKVIVWNVESGQRIIEVGEEYDTVLASDMSADQAWIALGGPSKLVKIYSTATGEQVNSIKKHTDWVTSLEYSPDGVLLCTGDRAGNVYVWEAYSGNLFYTLKGHGGAITGISWRPDSNVVATASEDGRVMLWEMHNGNRVKNWSAHGGGVQSVAYAPNGNIVTSGRDRQVKLWDGNGKQLRAFEGFPDIALSAVLSHDGKRVFGGDWTGELRVWKADDGKRIANLSANPVPLKTRVANLHSQTEKLKAETVAKEKALNDQINQARDAKARLVKYEETVATSKKIIDQSNNELNKARQLVKTTDAAIRNSERDVKRDEQKLAGVRKDIKNDQGKLAEARKAIEPAQAVLVKHQKELKDKVMALADTQKKLEAAKKDYDALKALVPPAKDSLTKAEQDYEQAKKASDAKPEDKALAEKTAKAKAELDAAVKAHEIAVKNASAMEGEVAKHTEQRKQIDKQRQDLANMVNRERNKVNELMGNLKKAEQKVSEGEAKLKALETEYQNNMKMLKEHRMAKETATKQVAEIDQRLQKATADMNSVSSKIKPTQEELKKANERVEAAKKESYEAKLAYEGHLKQITFWTSARYVGEVYSAKTELGALKNKHAATQSLVEEINSTIERTQKRLADSEQSMKEAPELVTQAEAKLKDVENMFVKVTQARAEAVKQEQATKAAFAKTQAEYKAVEAELGNNKKQVEELKKKLAEPQKAVDSAKAAYDKTTADLKAANEALDKNKDEKQTAELTKKRDEAQNKANQAKAAHDKAVAALNAVHDQIRKTDKMVELSKKRQAAEAAMNKAKAEHDKAAAAMKEADAKLKQATDLRNKAIAERDDAKLTLETTKKKIDGLKEKLAELKKQQPTAQAELAELNKKLPVVEKQLQAAQQALDKARTQ